MLTGILFFIYDFFEYLQIDCRCSVTEDKDVPVFRVVKKKSATRTQTTLRLSFYAKTVEKLFLYLHQNRAFIFCPVTRAGGKPIQSCFNYQCPVKNINCE